ncbi:TetR family transcriptional regulator [Longispora fulva]|uniref:AcrR family transcriptional regulator n=1 Tax=Longispora fulva TaxID=619741 RepID=A0A8J7GLC5_9ACTN|nr:TetR/AcrR family transcriptional regulator [Longispora fulva]MBG6140336.1 AcrR family transcriptional regulator [Longispora fulva]GIG57283.1 TetR family transcriptional regulator [Longispora fulva]
MGYHHGDLRRTLLATAAEVIAETGPAALSLRDLARRAGVSHAAPAHHFGDKQGLLTALATEGYELLAEALTAAEGDILDAGVAYIRFATEHPAHFEVMFHPALYREDEIGAARERSAAALSAGLASRPKEDLGPDPELTGMAAWSLVHGFATLALAGNLPPEVVADPRRVIRLLFEK